MFVNRRQQPPLFTAFLLGAGLLWYVQAVSAQSPEPVWADTAVAKKLIQESRRLNRDDDHNAALEKARQACAIYTRLYGGNHLESIKASMYVAREYRNLNREQESLAILEKCLPVLEASGDTLRTALCHHSMGLCLRKLYRYAEAHSHVEQAIALMRPDSVRQAVIVADMYLNIGSILNNEKKYRTAISVLEKSKAVYTLYGNKIGLGYAGYHLGDAWFGLHDFVRAKEHYLSALANLKHQIRPTHSYFADLYVKIGSCCQKTGEPETGLRHLLEAKEAYLKSGTEDLNYIQFLQYFGQFYLDEHQYAAAIEQLELCRSLKEKQYGVNSHRLIGMLQLLGDAYLQSGQPNQAESCYRRGLQLISSSIADNDQLNYRFYSKLAEVQFRQGDFAGCLLRCDTAFVIAGFDPEHPENMFPRDYFRDLCQLYARALVGKFRQTGELATLARAERYFARAAKTLYREVEEISVNSSREIFYDIDYPVLTEWLDARMDLYRNTGSAEHAETAFQISSQSKAFLLSDAMRRSGALRYAGVPDSIVEAELSLRERIVEAEKKLEAPGARNATRVDSASLALNRDLSSWREAYDALLRYIEQSYPEYYRLRLLRHDLSTRELRRQGVATGQALLMYSLTATNLYAFVLTRDTFFVAALPAIDPSLDQQVADFRKCLTTYFSSADPDDALYEQSLDGYLALAQSLYRQLILPVAAQLPERVTIIPDGNLCYLPFEALLTGVPKDDANFRTYPFWGCEKAISYGFSPNFLVDTAIRPAARSSVKTWLGLAPFAIDFENSGMVARALPDYDLSPLLFSGQEVRTIAALLQGDAWIGGEASPGRFLAEASRYRILHLATHSRADDRLGDYSYLAASRTGDVLPAKDLYQLSLTADMVVLSACEAGGGQLLRGEGIIGLVRAFTYAGARSIAASLWVANDKSTATLMVDFYRNLRAGMPKDIALQTARVHLLDQSPAEAHPFFWAGFRIYGDTAPLWLKP